MSFRFTPGCCCSTCIPVCSGVLPFNDLVDYIKQQHGQDNQYGCIRLFLPCWLNLYHHPEDTDLIVYDCKSFVFIEETYYTYFRDGVTAIDSDSDIVGSPLGVEPDSDLYYIKNQCYERFEYITSFAHDIPTGIWDGQVYGIWKKCAKPILGIDYDIIVYDSIGANPQKSAAYWDDLYRIPDHESPIILPADSRTVSGFDCYISFVMLTDRGKSFRQDDTAALSYIRDNWDRLTYITMTASMGITDSITKQFGAREGMNLCSRSGHDESNAVGSMIAEFSSSCCQDLFTYQLNQRGWTSPTTYNWTKNQGADWAEGCKMNYSATPDFTSQKRVAPYNIGGNFNRYKSEYGTIDEITSKDWWEEMCDEYLAAPYSNFNFHRHYEALYG